jgi:hypothetical protein
MKAPPSPTTEQIIERAIAAAAAWHMRRHVTLEISVRDALSAALRVAHRTIESTVRCDKHRLSDISQPLWWLADTAASSRDGVSAFVPNFDDPDLADSVLERFRAALTKKWGPRQWRVLMWRAQGIEYHRIADKIRERESTSTVVPISGESPADNRRQLAYSIEKVALQRIASVVGKDLIDRAIRKAQSEVKRRQKLAA